MPRDRRSSRGLVRLAALSAVVVSLLAVGSGPALAGKLSWLDEVVQQAIREAEAGGKAVARSADEVSTRAGGRLLLRGADESLETVARRSDDLARTLGRSLDEPADAALNARFSRLIGSDATFTKTFATLAPAERRLVVEMGESAQVLARRFPGQAEPMVRALGVDGLAAVRAYGPEVAEVIVKEGPESVNVLRKTGRAGWAFFNDTVLPNKGKLAAAGVLGLFLANPEQFVDTAGRATQYAVEQFAKAGIQLASAVGGGAVRGLETAIGDRLTAIGLGGALARYAGMALALLVAAGALFVLIGVPLRMLLAPVRWPLRLIRRLLHPARVA